MNARVKELAGGLVELHVENATQIEKVAEKVEKLSPYEPKKISDIKEGEGPLTIEATILTTPALHEVTTSRKEKVKVANFDVTDNTGRISVSLWRRFADLAKELTPGTRILLRNVYAKRGFAGRLELTTGASTKIEVLSDSELKAKS
jgi:ssDNA-binding replication factor A large subunit